MVRIGMVGGALLVLPFLCLAGCGPSAEEIAQTIDERVEARLVEERLIKSEDERQAEAAVEAAKPEWERSMDFLADLDELMAGYSPTLPDEVDNTDVLRCTTDYELGVDNELKTGARSLVKQAEASARARDKQRKDFEKNKWVQYRVDYSWESRNGTSPVAGCRFEAYQPYCWRGCVGPNTCDGSHECHYKGMKGCREQYDNGKGNFADQYVVKTRYYAEADAPSYRYSENGMNRYSRTTTPERPELMKRIDSEQLAIPERFHCKVVNARKEKDQMMIQCKGDDPVLTHLQITGDLTQMVHRGDQVSVPIGTGKASQAVDGTITKDEIRIGRVDYRVWLIHANGDALVFDELGECPTREAILEAASK